MMDTDRPHHRSNSINGNNNNNRSVSSCSSTTTTTTKELFICFTARLSSSSSSSMKISSTKSILSPGRAREPSQISLSNSLSRRLRSNGSMKGGQASPMFPTASNGKKRGCAAFENPPEPSSPKVTCIGQVRVKTKKRGKKKRTGSQRRSGDVSFRRLEISNNNIGASSVPDCEQSSHLNHQFLNHHQQQQDCLSQRNQRWVHLPVSICEALRAFGAEFNCFLPCRSSCMASEKGKGEKAAVSNSSGSCGAVFSRWLVAVQEGDGKGRKIELVVGEEEAGREEEREENSREGRSYRRHVFEDFEFKEEKFEGGNGSLQEEEARVSICIPPKNALLLMRCRSDPVRMAALANKFWEAPIPKDDGDDDDEEEEEEEEKEDDKAGENDGNLEEEKRNAAEEDGEDGESESRVKQTLVDKKSSICEHGSSCEVTDEHQIQEIEAIVSVLEVGSGEDCQNKSTGSIGVQGKSSVEPEEENQLEFPRDGGLLEDTVEPAGDLQGSRENENEDKVIQENHLYHEHKQEEEQGQQVGYGDRVQVLEPEREPEREPEEVGQQDLQQDQYEDQDEGGEEERMNRERPEPEDPKTREGQLGMEWTGRESQPLLPDCLLLMMCEPKLSMEVSKETWVCSTDFIRWLPQPSRQVNQRNGKDEAKKRTSIDGNHAAVHNNLQQPPRSSCSYPAKPPARLLGTESMATVIEQRLVGGKACEPLVLPRCKSEPMRSATKLSPEACFWKNRKLEPHRPTTLGVGAAGVGF